jgi:Bacterial protein of unknown function (DUF916)
MKILRPYPSTHRLGMHCLSARWRAAAASAALVAALFTTMIVLLAGQGPEARAAASVPSTGGTLAASPLAARLGSAGPGPTKWSVHPSGAKALDARVRFSYTGVEPGAQISDYVAVTNESQHSQVFAVYASDAYTTSTGAYDLLPAGQRSVKAGAWIRLAKSSVNLPPHDQAIIPFTLTVPPNIAPGDYSAGIVAQITIPGKGARVDERIGARVYVRVSGALRPSLGVGGLLTSYQGNANPVGGGNATVTYTITNTGNVRLGYAQQVTISGWFGSATVHPPPLAQLLPGDSIALHATVPDVWPAGPLTAKVTLTALSVAGTTSPPAPVSDESYSLFEFPWPQLVALVLLALLGLAVWWGVRRRRAHIAALLGAAEERGRAHRAEDRSRAPDPSATPEAPR